MYLPGQAGPRQFLGRLNVPTSAYEQAIANLGPQAAWRLQEIDPGPALSFLQDEMTDTDGVLLSAHTGNSLHTWTIHPAFAGTAEINTNRLRSVTTARANYYSSDVPTGPDYVVEARVVKVGTDISNTGVFARLNTASPMDCYYLIHRDLTNVWELGKTVAGTATAFLTSADTFAVNDIRTAQLRCNGSLIQGVIDGVVVMEVTDASITAPGRPGVWVQQSINGTMVDWVRAYKAANLADSSGNVHNGMAIAGFTMGVDGFGTGEGTVFTDVTPEQGYARFPGYQPFQPGTSRTFAGISKIEVSTGGPQVMFGSRGPLTGGTNPVCVLEATGAGFQTVHWVSNVAVMSTLAAQWIGVLPAIGNFFHWALTVVDTGSGNQTLELFINGVSHGPSISGFQQPTWDPTTGDYMLGMRAGLVEAAPLHEFVGRNGMQAVYNSILTPTQIQNLARTAGFLATGVPLQASAAVSSATLAITATTAVPLQASTAVSTATLNLTAPTIVPLQASSAQSSATLAIFTPKIVLLDPASAQSSATLTLTAPTQVPLGAASAQSSATLALTAQTTVALGVSSAQSSATLALTAKTTITLGASSAQSSATLNLAQYVPLQASSAVSSATLVLTTATRVPLGASSAVSSATLALTAPTRVVLGASTATSSATIALTAQTYIPLGASSAVSSATLVVTVPGSSIVPLSPASAISSATLSLTAKTAVPLGAASAVSSASLTLTAKTVVPLVAASGVSSASLNLTAPTVAFVPLNAASSTLNATLALSILSGAFITLAPVFATSSGTLVIGVGRWQWGEEENWPEDPEGDWPASTDDRWSVDNEDRWVTTDA